MGKSRSPGWQVQPFGLGDDTVRGIFRLFGMILFAPVVLLLASGTYANHVAVPWPDYNFYWMANRVYHVAADRPQVNVVSNICDYTLQEDSAIANTRAQTAGTSELGDMKSLGYALYRYTCNSNPDSVPTDIFLSYEANYPYGSSGGFTLHQKATADWWAMEHLLPMWRPLPNDSLEPPKDTRGVQRPDCTTAPERTGPRDWTRRTL